MFFALERTNMQTTSHIPTWAVYGFFKAVFDLLADKKLSIKPNSIAVAFDVSKATFRLEQYSEYKANRLTMPDTLRTQLEIIKEGLKVLDIPIYTMEGFEGDDVIGTIKNASYQNDLVSNPEKTAREFLDDLVISNETPSEKTDEITVIQNIGDENFVEIEKLKKDKTTVRYKIEMPEGVDGSVDYEKIENTSLKDLIEQNKVSQAAIDINSDGNEEISFSFENGDVNNTTVKFDTDSDGILDKKVTIQIVDYKK